MPFDFDAAVLAPFRMQPGLRRVAEGAPWATASSLGSPHLRAKCEVLPRVPDEALLALPDFDAAPVFDALAGPLRREAGGRLVAPALGWSVDGTTVEGDGPADLGECLRALPAASRKAGLASLAVAEDLAVVDAATGRIPWLAVCLPSRWSPAEKLGLGLADIHAPVADGATLVAASQALTRLVTAGERWERFVWTLTPSPALDAHPRRQAVAAWPEAAVGDALAAATFFRTEHQQFVPLAEAVPRRALFAIRIEVEPLAAVAASPDRAGRLHASLASMSDAVLAYRSLTPVRDRLLAWLAARAR